MGTNIRKWLIISGVFICALVLSFALGRYTVPEKVRIEEKVKVVEVEKQVVVVQEKIRIERVLVQSENTSIHRSEHSLEHPDGLKETFKSESINVDKVVKESDVKIVDHIVEKEVIKYKDNEVQKIVYKESDKPNWRIGPMIGLDVPKFEWTDPKSSIIYGGVVERRVWGPVSAGVWALSSKSGGVVVTIEF